MCAVFNFKISGSLSPLSKQLCLRESSNMMPVLCEISSQGRRVNKDIESMLRPSRWDRPPQFRHSRQAPAAAVTQRGRPRLKCAPGCCRSADPSEWLRLTIPPSAECQGGAQTVEQKEQIAYTCRAERRVRLMRGIYVRGAWGEPSSKQELTTNQSWEGWRGAPGDHAWHGQTRKKTACSLNCLLMPTSHLRYHFQTSCPRTALWPKNYWQGISLTGRLWKSVSPA